MALKNRVQELIAEKAQKEGRKISHRDAEKESGVSRSTIWRLTTQQVQQLDFEVAEKLARWLDCKPGDLIAWEDEADSESNAPTGIGAGVIPAAL